MTMFWIAAGLFIAAALLFLIPPLLQRSGADGERRHAAINLDLYREKLDQVDRDAAAGILGFAEVAEARRDIERQLHEDLPQTHVSAGAGMRGRWMAVVIALSLPLAAALIYRAVGNPLAFADPSARQVARGAGDKHAMDRDQIVAMVERLAGRMKDSPQDIDGWIMLARSYATLGRYDESARAYELAVALQPTDPGLLADRADILAMARGRKLAGEPYDLVKRALAIDPRHLKALSLAASAEFEAGNKKGAIAYWERMAQLVPADSRLGQSVRNNIAEASGVPATPVTPGTDASGVPVVARAAGAVPPGGGAVSGKLRLADSLRASVAAEDTVFVFARAAEGQRMPLAIRRVRVADLPYDFVLDDSAAVMPGTRISSVSAVVVGARISKSGNATPQKGDLVGALTTVPTGTGGVDVLIDRVQQ